MEGRSVFNYEYKDWADLVPRVDTELFEIQGGLFCNGEDLVKTLDAYPREGQLFRVGLRFYEVLHYVNKLNSYQVRRFSIMLSKMELADLATPKYGN